MFVLHSTSRKHRERTAMTGVVPGDQMHQCNASDDDLSELNLLDSVPLENNVDRSVRCYVCKFMKRTDVQKNEDLYALTLLRWAKIKENSSKS